MAIASSALIDDDIAAGRLVVPFSEPKLAAEGYCAYLPKPKLNDPTVAAFCEWLQRITDQGKLARFPLWMMNGDQAMSALNFGSGTGLLRTSTDVRFTPQSGH